MQAGISASPSGKGHMSFDIDACQVNISGEKYLNQIGPRVTFSQKVTKKSRAMFTVAAYEQNYEVLRRAPLEDERDGVKTRFHLGVQTALNPSQKVNWAVSYDTKDAEIGPFSFLPIIKLSNVIMGLGPCSSCYYRAPKSLFPQRNSSLLSM